MKSKDIRQVLDTFDVRPSRSLGQNFLVDENIARWIVEQLDIRPEDCVVEVGPGTGALTEHIAPLCRKLVLVEFDARLADYQRTRWQNDPHVEVHHADGAEWDPRRLFAEQPVKFMGNLPYSAGGAILQNFLSSPSAVSRAVVMLQKEFIDRILALPGDDAYGLLSLRIQRDWVPRALKTVPPEAFHPRPKIDSTVMLLTPRDRKELPPFDAKLMDELMRRCFSQRRKQMHKQLPDNPPWKNVAASIGAAETARPEELGLSQWVNLTNAYDTNPLAAIAQKDDEIFDVVDEQDHILKQATRKEVHAENLIHRAVHIIVFNKNRDCLIQKRSVRKDRHPGVWDSSAAGHVDAGEDYDTAAQRELQEELGIEDARLIRIGTLPPTAQTGWEHIAVYLAGYTGKIHFPAAEIEAVLPLAPELIDHWIERRPEDFAHSFIACWQLACRYFSEA
ncbi:16S rRNA (adenine(1518)-N(6)/adenine(1519)-N(6))-dimethyltransferase RsmA [Akkermansia glycaniphila]|uniref:Ribosomal RNA small subunit methyltransferase A n=1 Tax=Akkermansia glycaniphila TaxID=1679444 RepID=A0A1C7PEV3_9BACT|nr:16S rRNA (adenine(1518)-N(6)/adenine(1519)-N(6))-dimethyltransferase RsmA [Akkermansia glycaniphila]OCA04097.1 dimethyladenosine transferase [Akkermansia glycaniphila]SEH69920.1 s-adenosyl-l-methionine-dependent methyltransferase [Akkermansia glycaniphila]